MTFRNTYVYLILGIAIMAITVLMHVFLGREASIQAYIESIEQQLHAQEEKVLFYINDQPFIDLQLRQAVEKDSFFNGISRQEIETLSEEPYTIALFRNSDLIFWSNNKVLPPAGLLKVQEDNIQSFQSLGNGQYLVYMRRDTTTDWGQFTIFGLIPVKYNYLLESDYLKPRFVAHPDIPAEIALSTEPSNYPIRRANGQTICYIHGEVNFLKDASLQRWVLLGYFLGFILIAISLHKISIFLATQNKAWMGAAFLLGTILNIRAITLALNWGSYFDKLSLFQITFDIPFTPTLGDFLFNILLLLWAMLFLHGTYRERSYANLKPRQKHLYAFTTYFLTVLYLFFVFSFLKRLVIQTNLYFDFDRLLDLNRSELLVVLGIICLLLALFLFCQTMMHTVKKMGLQLRNRYLLIGLALLISVPLQIWTVNLLIPALNIYLVIALFLVTMDAFVFSRYFNFGWLITWLMILSAIPAFFLFQYKGYKDQMIRTTYAQELSQLRDSLAEPGIAIFLQRVKQDVPIRNLTFRADTNLLPKDSLEQRLEVLFSNSNYLHYNYGFSVYGFNDIGQIALNGQRMEQYYLSKQFQFREPTPFESLQFGTDFKGKPLYRGQLELLKDTVALQLYFEFRRLQKEPSKVYTELLVQQPYKNLANLSDYNFAIYNKEGNLIDSEGEFVEQYRAEVPPIDQAFHFEDGAFSNIVYRAPTGILVVVERLKRTFFNGLHVFSFFFACNLIVLAFLAGFNSLIRFLPDTLNLSLTGKPSLRKRIQLSITTLTATFFILIGLVTFQFFQQSTEDYHENRMVRKTLAMITDAEHELEVMDIDPNASSESFASLVEPLSRIHRMDINLYDLSGTLVRSSSEDLYDKHVMSRQISPLAYYALTRQGYKSYSASENIGGLPYKTAYAPISVRAGQQKTPKAFLGLPYYSKQRQLRSSVNEIMNTLLNVYVLLLLVAGFVSILVSGSITRGITKIGEKIKEFRLGGKNEPLEWRTQDELGELINAYNRMTAQLEESAERLAQNEREVAWREMAKQVAHEIKNPLTPMKLSIQYMMHAYQRNPQDVKPLLERVSSTLIEQIENLSQIASEFSSFAKMPNPENQKILLNQLVRSVYDLFKETNDVLLTLDMTEEPIYIFADKNQLISVLNNLIKNAIQAIPEERTGLISLFLTKEQETATIKVQDNGTGIPEAMQDKVFVPNFTTKNSGTGLGLAICKNIIEIAGGRIYFDTKVQEGTSFFVQLPVLSDEALEEGGFLQV